MIRTIPTKESLTIEFKSDRSRLPDRELIETVVCLANTEIASFSSLTRVCPKPLSF
jgi:hypothetical protein